MKPLGATFYQLAARATARLLSREGVSPSDVASVLLAMQRLGADLVEALEYRLEPAFTGCDPMRLTEHAVAQAQRLAPEHVFVLSPADDGAFGEAITDVARLGAALVCALEDASSRMAPGSIVVSLRRRSYRLLVEVSAPVAFDAMAPMLAVVLDAIGGQVSCRPEALGSRLSLYAPLASRAPNGLAALAPSRHDGLHRQGDLLARMAMTFVTSSVSAEHALAEAFDAGDGEQARAVARRLGTQVAMAGAMALEARIGVLAHAMDTGAEREARAELLAIGQLLRSVRDEVHLLVHGASATERVVWSRRARS